MRNLAIVAGLVLLAAPGLAGAASTHKSTAKSESGATAASAQQKDILSNLARDNMKEIALGQLAIQRAASDDVRDFGQRMVNDHSQMLVKLATYARNHQIKLPAMLEQKDRQEIEPLAKLSGEQFDRQYMQAMVQGHSKDVQALDQHMQGSDQDLNGFLKDTADTVRSHLDQAKQIASAKTGAAPRANR